MEPKYTFFYNSISPFSNFHRAPFFHTNTMFLTSEHCFMWYKALSFWDTATAEAILKAKTPAEAKAFGRTIASYSDTAWDKIADDIMYYSVLSKFRGNPNACSELMRTGDSVLVECSPSDKRWGIGLGIGDGRRLDESKWRGQNRLGLALMRARDKIKSDQHTSRFRLIKRDSLEILTDNMNLDECHEATFDFSDGTYWIVTDY